MKELPINPPDPEELPTCPECGEELGMFDKIYLDRAGNCVGCTCCIEYVYPEDYFTD